jgi:hypothetical protein
MGVFDWLFGKKSESVEKVEDAESDQPHDPPTAQRVAARAMVLGLVAYRASLEQSPGNAEFKRLHARLPEWIESLGLAAELEPQEAALLGAPLGRGDPRVVTNSGWRTEGLAVLGWAMSRFELPTYDFQADPRAATASVGFTEEKLAAMDIAEARELLRSATVASPPVIGVFSSHITVVGWRLRQFRLAPGRMDYVGLLRSYPKFKEHWLENARFIDGDLAIGDQAIADAPAEYVSTCEGSADERRIAAYWLQGDDPIYSRVDPSTLLSCA